MVSEFAPSVSWRFVREKRRRVRAIVGATQDGLRRFGWEGKMKVPALVEFSMHGRLLTTGCVAAAALAAAHAQQQPPSFGTTTRTVAVYATVTDPRGRLAPDLVRDNFEVDD